MVEKLTDIEKRYCRCILHVAGKKGKGKGAPRNPWAICTASVYTEATGKSRKGALACGPYYAEYGFEKFTLDELRGYAQFKKIPRAASMTKEELVDTLYRIVATEYTGSTKNVWMEYVKEYRKNNPNLSWKETMKRASEEYQEARRRLVG